VDQRIFPINGLGEWAPFLKMAGLPRRPLNLARPNSAWQGLSSKFCFILSPSPRACKGGFGFFGVVGCPIFLGVQSLSLPRAVRAGSKRLLPLSPPLLATFAVVALAAAVFSFTSPDLRRFRDFALDWWRVGRPR
jgi:hypothetical protein